MAIPILITKLKNKDGGFSCVVQVGCSQAALVASLVSLEALGVNIETLNIKDDSKERPRPSRQCVKAGSASQQAFPGHLWPATSLKDVVKPKSCLVKKRESLLAHPVLNRWHQCVL